MAADQQLHVLQATAWYPPSSIGGTEVYLSGLIRNLRTHNVSSRVVAPLAPQVDDYDFDGTPVRTYAVSASPSRAELRGELPRREHEQFRAILSEERPQIYHQHSWTRGLGGSHLRIARELGLKTVLTVHTPNVICLRGTMMRFGEAPCDGEVRRIKCAECWSQGCGAPKPLARILARIPASLASGLGSARLKGRAGTALAAQGIVDRRMAELAALIADADRVVAVCQWLYDALLRNGVPKQKLLLSRQGVDDRFASFALTRHSTPPTGERAFRIVYLGRWHPVKGVHILVQAVRRIPRDVPLELVLHGIGEGPEERAYEARVRDLARGDPRIAVCPSVPPEQLADVFMEADAVAIPSLWMETGPLVAMEAKATGTPILGSKLGGIAEIVREPEEGVLVPPGDAGAWENAIKLMMSNTATLRRALPGPARTTSDVAGEMAQLYRSLC